MWQEKPLTGFLSKVGLASGVKEGIQKLGRLWLEVAAEPALEDSVELLLSVEPFSPTLLCPKGVKKRKEKSLDDDNAKMQQKDEAAKVDSKNSVSEETWKVL